MSTGAPVPRLPRALRPSAGSARAGDRAQDCREQARRAAHVDIKSVDQLNDCGLVTLNQVLLVQRAASIVNVASSKPRFGLTRALP